MIELMKIQNAQMKKQKELAKIQQIKVITIYTQLMKSAAGY